MINIWQENLQKNLIKMILLFLIGFLGIWGGTVNDLPNDDMIRLHIFANSDNAGDQCVKLIVRDAVTEYMADLNLSGLSYEETEEVITANLAEIDALADGIAENYGYTACTEYGIFNFGKRNWQGEIMPAGDYKALRIKLGEGGGHNWFCVLYPDMCFQDKMGELEKADLSLDEGEEQSETVKIRFGSFFLSLFN